MLRICHPQVSGQAVAVSRRHNRKTLSGKIHSMKYFPNGAVTAHSDEPVELGGLTG
jgi:hypothetical protein